MGIYWESREIKFGDTRGTSWGVIVPSGRGIVRPATGLPSPRGLRGATRGLRGATYATLFGLLAVTGLRIGEAVGLDDRNVDVDTAVLHVRHAKNGRSRVVPFTECTAERLRAYRAERNRILGVAPTAFFVGENERRLNICMAGYSLGMSL